MSLSMGKIQITREFRNRAIRNAVIGSIVGYIMFFIFPELLKTNYKFIALIFSITGISIVPQGFWLAHEYLFLLYPLFILYLLAIGSVAWVVLRGVYMVYKDTNSPLWTKLFVYFLFVLGIVVLFYFNWLTPQMPKSKFGI